MPARRDLLIVGAVGLAAAAAGALVGPLALQSNSGAADLLSARYPDVSGNVRQMLEWKGKTLVANFWATWCAPCREEIPLLAANRSKYASKGVEVVGIGIDSAEKIAQFAKEVPMAYPVLVAGAPAIDVMRKLGNQSGGLPYTVILDPSGAVAYRRLGALKPGELEKVLDGMLR
jgi:thiol-disulfide isomerase/thioredoxin